MLKLNWIIDVVIRTCTKFWAQFSDLKCRNGQEKCDDFGKQVPLPLLISYRGFYVAHHVCIWGCTWSLCLKFLQRWGATHLFFNEFSVWCIREDSYSTPNYVVKWLWQVLQRRLGFENVCWGGLPSQCQGFSDLRWWWDRGKKAQS